MDCQMGWVLLIAVRSPSVWAGAVTGHRRLFHLQEPGTGKGSCAGAARECLDSGHMSSVLWSVGDCPVLIGETLLHRSFWFCSRLPSPVPVLFLLLGRANSTTSPSHFSIPFTLFPLSPLSCCSHCPYYSTLPLSFPLLCLLTFPCSRLVFCAKTFCSC